MIKEHYRPGNQYKCSWKGQAPKAREAGESYIVYNEHETFSKNNFLSKPTELFPIFKPTQNFFQKTKKGGRMVYFKDAKVGDRVYDLVYGEGTIVNVNICPEFVSRPITAEFQYTFIDKEILEYALSGKHTGTYENQRLFYYDNRPIVITQDDLDIKDADEYCLDDYSFTGNTSRDWADEITIQDYTEEKYTRKIRRETPEIVKDIVKEAEPKLGLWFLREELVKAINAVQEDVDSLERRLDEI